MVAILTGDIINSREGKAINWLKNLKEVLNYYGTTPKQWEIYRGDSFQLSLAAEQSIMAAIHIKAVIKKSKALDVRIAIGLGDVTHKAKKITESNGTAYIRSGECFESLKKQTLAIRTGDNEQDELINLMISLALLSADNWSSTVAEVIKTVLEHPQKNQKEIAALLNKSQSSVSEALKRGGYEEMMNLNRYFQSQLSSL